MAVHDTLLPHRADVEMRPDPMLRDSSGGVVDSPWTVEFGQVPCLVDTSPSQVFYDFGGASVKVTHVVQTLTPVTAGRRLKLADGTYLRVLGYAKGQGQGGGTIPDWYALACEEIRFS